MRTLFRFTVIAFWLDIILSNTQPVFFRLWPFPYEIETPLSVLLMLVGALVFATSALINAGERKNP